MFAVASFGNGINVVVVFQTVFSVDDGGGGSVALTTGYLNKYWYCTEGSIRMIWILVFTNTGCGGSMS